jgi:hypothetical protein
MAASCKHGNYISGSMKAGTVLTSGGTTNFLKLNAAPRKYTLLVTKMRNMKLK